MPFCIRSKSFFQQHRSFEKFIFYYHWRRANKINGILLHVIKMVILIFKQLVIIFNNRKINLHQWLIYFKVIRSNQRRPFILSLSFLYYNFYRILYLIKCWLQVVFLNRQRNVTTVTKLLFSLQPECNMHSWFHLSISASKEIGWVTTSSFLFK